VNCQPSTVNCQPSTCYVIGGEVEKSSECQSQNSSVEEILKKYGMSLDEYGLNLEEMEERDKAYLAYCLAGIANYYSPPTTKLDLLCFKTQLWNKINNRKDAMLLLKGVTDRF